MKIRPVILCGGSGTRLWPNSKNNQAKQFIDFGGWNLIEKTLKRIKSSIFDYPIISTNLKYFKLLKFYLKKFKIKKYIIILEPAKRNTAAAILSSTLIKEIPPNQSLIFFPADHLLEKVNFFNSVIYKNKKNLTDKNIFIFGIKPKFPSNEYGYFLSKKDKKRLNKVTKFIEKPAINKAKKIIKKNGYWNSGMFFFRKDSLINNFKEHEPLIYKRCFNSVTKGKFKNKTYFLNKENFLKTPAKSFDYAILEKANYVNSINLNVPWSDLGSWKEISKIYKKDIKKYLKKSKTFYRPWGKYINLFEGKNFLVKELTVNPLSSISLQKHFHRSEHWLVTEGKPKITINKIKSFKKIGDSVFVPSKAIHRIENFFKNPVKIIEVQTGTILKENDIVRYKDIYSRI